MELKKCKTCGKEISETAQVCPHCGETLPCLYLKCPKCGSIHITSRKAKTPYFGIFIGIIFTPIFLHALFNNPYTRNFNGLFSAIMLIILGFLTINAPVIVCLKCGYAKTQSYWFSNYKKFFISYSIEHIDNIHNENTHMDK